jgi:hypothetical protein
MTVQELRRENEPRLADVFRENHIIPGCYRVPEPADQPFWFQERTRVIWSLSEANFGTEFSFSPSSTGNVERHSTIERPATP